MLIISLWKGPPSSTTLDFYNMRQGEKFEPTNSHWTEERVWVWKKKPHTRPPIFHCSRKLTEWIIICHLQIQCMPLEDMPLLCWSVWSKERKELWHTARPTMIEFTLFWLYSWACPYCIWWGYCFIQSIIPVCQITCKVKAPYKVRYYTNLKLSNSLVSFLAGRVFRLFLSACNALLHCWQRGLSQVYGKEHSVIQTLTAVFRHYLSLWEA